VPCIKRNMKRWYPSIRSILVSGKLRGRLGVGGMR
jgi:hypothetical protein